MAFGGGLRGTLYEDMAIGLKAGVGAQYFSFNPGRVAAYPRGYTQDATWDELQATAFFSLTQEMYKYARLIEPFALTSASLCAGISYSTVDIDWETDGSSGTLEADDNVGFIAGFDLVFNELYTLSLEARFGAEDAYTLGFSVRF
jgi:hypothetical protein